MKVTELVKEAGKRAEPPTALRFNLLENGLDFIREGVEALYGEFTRPEPHAYKYALLHIFSGTLLVLKERLRQAHPSLIFQKVADANKPGAHTVDFGEVINRLEGAVGIALSKDDRKLLHDVRDQRNAIEHYEANLELKEVNARVGELVDFLERFLHDHLKESLLAHLSGDAARDVAELAGVAKRLRERRKAEWQQRAQKYAKISKRKLTELAEENEYHPKHNPDGGLRACPSCWTESVAIVERDIGICTNGDCREVHMLSDCHRCDGFTFGEGLFCEECSSYIQYQMDKDD
ncbi:MAG TPA: hypothetical protein VHB79_24065 [Polyangiaceae bacterium]|nr:hypothetical protein [Polyangiaceae bacterium]